MRFTRYIWPTRRGWIIALSSVLWFFISLVNQTLFAFLLAATAAALTIVSFISAMLSLRGIQVRRAAAGDATVGHFLALPLEISNSRNRRRQDLVVQENIPCAPEKTTVNIVSPLPRRGTILLDRQVLAVRRGEFKLGDVILRSGDPAGLFFRERRFALSGSVVVYPAILPVPDLFLHKYESAPTTTAQPISTAGTSQDFYGVREYHVGDGMRYIHWRSSARYGRLMVKEFERNAIASAAIILDAQEHFVSDNLLSNLEYQVQAAASISNHCSGLYCSLAFAAGGSKMILMEPQTAASANAAIRYSLATLKPGKVSLLPVLSALLPLLSRNTVVFCLSLSDNPPLRSALDALLAAGMDVRWCCADRASFAGKSKDRLKARQKARQKARKHKTHPAQARTFVRAVQATPDSKLEHVLNLTYMQQ